ncbi:repeat outer membrane protein [Anaeramoeba flamelloides]|uniref:Repeat outer membrane protein n=1 Tax=Anaeramoeba flamelloides TaxID=1746091 RepID=A0ABQ8X8V1_9EUKA|nr:repeat outer membrane protein [Anaeramoeba flamelloides]
MKNCFIYLIIFLFLVEPILLIPSENNEIYQPRAQMERRKEQQPRHQMKESETKGINIPTILIKNNELSEEKTNLCEYEMISIMQKYQVCFRRESIIFILFDNEEIHELNLSFLGANEQELNSIESKSDQKNGSKYTTINKLFQKGNLSTGSEQFVNVEKIIYQNIYPNISLEFEIAQNHLKSSFILQKAFDFNQIKLNYSIKSVLRGNKNKNGDEGMSKSDSENDNKYQNEINLNIGPNGELNFVKENQNDQKIIFSESTPIYQQYEKYFRGKAQIIEKNQKINDYYDSNWIVAYSLFEQQFIDSVDLNSPIIIDPYFFSYLGSDEYEYFIDASVKISSDNQDDSFMVMTGFTDGCNWEMVKDAKKINNFFDPDFDYDYCSYQNFIVKVSLDAKDLIWISYFLGDSYSFYVWNIEVDTISDDLILGGTSNFGKDKIGIDLESDFKTYEDEDRNNYIAKLNGNGKVFKWFRYIAEDRKNHLEMKKNGEIIYHSYTNNPINDTNINEGCLQKGEINYILLISNDGKNILKSNCYYNYEFYSIPYFNEMKVISKDDTIDNLIIATGLVEKNDEEFMECIFYIIDSITLEVKQSHSYLYNDEDTYYINCYSIDYSLHMENIIIGGVSSMSADRDDYFLLKFDFNFNLEFEKGLFSKLYIEGEEDNLRTIRYLGYDTKTDNEAFVMGFDNYLYELEIKDDKTSIKLPSNNHVFAERGSYVEFLITGQDEIEIINIIHTGNVHKIVTYGDENPKKYVVSGNIDQQIDTKWVNVIETDYQIPSTLQPWAMHDIFIQYTYCKPGYQTKDTLLDETYGVYKKECVECEKGEYGNGKTGTCEECGMGTYSSDKKRSAYDECEDCPIRYFGNSTGQTSMEKACFICQEGTFCNTEGLQYSEDIKCFYEDACLGENLCRPGFNESTKHPCTVCKEGYLFQKGKCYECYKSGVWIFFIVFIAAILAIFLLFFFCFKGAVKAFIERFGAVKSNMMIPIFITFFQYMSIVTSMQLNWPSQIDTVSKAIGLANFDVDSIFSFQCISPKVDFFDVYLIKFLFYLFLMIGFFLFCLYKKYVKKMDKKELSCFFWNYLGLLLKFIYIPVLVLSITPFDAKPIETDGTTEYRLEADFNIILGDGKWNRYLPLFVIVLVFFALGIPIFFLTIIIIYKRASNIIFWKERIPWLFDKYLPNKIWWELIELFSKATIVSIIIMISRYPKYQGWITFACFTVVTLLLVWIRPFKPTYIDYYKKYKLQPPKYFAETRISIGTYLLLLSLISLGLETLGIMAFLAVWSFGIIISTFGVKNNLELILLEQLENNSIGYDPRSVWKKDNIKKVIRRNTGKFDRKEIKKALKKSKKKEKNEKSGSNRSSSKSSSSSSSSSNSNLNSETSENSDIEMQRNTELNNLRRNTIHQISKN